MLLNTDRELAELAPLAPDAADRLPDFGAATGGLLLGGLAGESALDLSTSLPATEEGSESPSPVRPFPPFAALLARVKKFGSELWAAGPAIAFSTDRGTMRIQV
jgi:hypothetical protein